MKRFFNRLFDPLPSDNANSTAHIYNLTIFFIILLTLIIFTVLLIFLPCNKLSGIVTFLLTGGASLAGGAALGFLFGLPRAERFRFIRKEDFDHYSRDNTYGDNTNLEEVSDWLTKIIVGLTLIKLNVILSWIHTSAQSFNRVFNSDCCKDCEKMNAYVFGYATIVLYFLTGAGLCYLWARTNLSYILTKSRIDQRNMEKNTELVAELQKKENKQFVTSDGITRYISPTTKSKTLPAFPSIGFHTKTESTYQAKQVFDKTDLQRGRWGGSAKNGNYTLEAFPVTPGKKNIQLVIKNLDSEKPLVGDVAFFLHDTFASEIVYTIAINNKAEISFWAYEAFVVGARLEDGTELELDLNKVTGFPATFYWKE